ncbi:MAG: ArsB/NhaD family transporter [Chloroflexi bacterium]|nr:ArsB/NhaD family transporter [Chloroflexota bacterium]
MNDVLLAVAIFVIVYGVIVSEKVDRMVAALLGGMVMILLVSGYDQEIAFHAIDLNVIFLLTGMMIMANILSETGVFQWLAITAVHVGGGNPVRVMQVLAIVTAVGSAFLDNVTVVVLIAPVTLFVASTLEVSPVPLLISEVLASNIGGAATLIGDPPNILIGSAAGIDFATFMWNMGPLVVILLLVFVLMIPLLFGRSLSYSAEASARGQELRTEGLISDPVLLRQSLIVLGIVILGFLLHSMLQLETATVALTGAALLLLWTRRDPHQIMKDVEWSTLFFFVGLFILVEGLVFVGAIEIAASWLFRVTGGSLPVTSMVLLWVSGAASGIIDNIPYTATMIPLIKSLGEAGMNTGPLWWALAIGADMGGNATLVGASANLVVASFAARSGHKISFLQFSLYGLVTTFITLVLGSVYLWLRYLL